MKTIVTHNGPFHADDVFAVAALKLLPEWKDAEVIRTRDPEIIMKGNLVLDIGFEYDSARLRFDHHQPGGAGMRDNGIPFASIGLIWKQYGDEIAGSLAVSQIVDRRLIQPIDANDVGVSLVASAHPSQVTPYVINSVISGFRPTWEDAYTFDEGFLSAIPFAQKILYNEIRMAHAEASAEKEVESAYETAEDTRIVVVDTPFPFGTLGVRHPDVFFFIAPRSEGKGWKAEAIPVAPGTFTYKQSFPVAWRAKRDADLQSVSGVSDAEFCHASGFAAYAESKEGAIRLATLALNA